MPLGELRVAQISGGENFVSQAAAVTDLTSNAIR